MKLLKNEKTDNYHEIEVQRSFLWIKWNVKYRKTPGNIFRYKHPNNYYDTGISEYLSVIDLFDISI